jgi:hypothetical protein
MTKNDKIEAESTAELAYKAYGEEVGGVNFRGEPMPEFHELPEKIKSGWQAAATALLSVFIGVFAEVTGQEIDVDE